MDPSLAFPLIRQIHEAALDPARYEDFVQGLSDAFGGAPTGFALQLPGFPLSGVLYVSQGFRDEFRAPFAAHATSGLPWEEARRHNFLERFGLASEVISEAAIRETDFYRDWMEPQGLAAAGPMGHTIAVDGGRPVAGLAIFGRQADPPFGQAELGFGDLLVPHLALSYRMLAEARRYRALSDAIDRFPTGVVLLDAQGHVVSANHGARQIFDRDDGLALLDGNLRAATVADDTALRALVTATVEAATSGGAGESGVLAIRRRSVGRAYPVMVGPLRPHGGEPTLADAVAVLYVTDLDGGALRRREALHDLYGLTEAETQLVDLLCQGSSLEEVAHVRGVTMNTARTQLKQVFAKTQTSRQSELVRLVLSGVASIGGS